MRAVIVLLLFFLPPASSLAVPALRVEVVRDNSIVLVSGEERLNGGSKTRIRIKGNQHLVALAFDTAPLRGRRVESAVLVCHRDAREIEGVTLATIQADWDETKSNALTSGLGKVSGWGAPGVRFPAVTGGNSFSLVSRARSQVRDGAYHFKVDPDLVNACAIGAAFGISIHEWSSDYSRNPTILSREAGKRGPYLLVTFGGKEPKPEPPMDLALSSAGDPDSVRLRLRAPERGFAYAVRVNGKALPRWNIPFVRPGEVQTVMIRDVPLRPGGPLRVEVATLDRLGRRSKGVSAKGRVPDPPRVPDPKVAELPSARGGARGVAVIPVLDKYDESGKPVGELPKDHRLRNAVFDGETVRLRAARGEVVGFQVLVRGKGRVRVAAKLPGLRTEARRALFVEAGGRRVPDPLVPFDSLELREDRDEVVVVDVFVPFAEKRRIVRGSLSLSDGRKVPIELAVRGFSIPREATFLCEMNTYGVPDTVAEFYRLQEVAYDHRVHVNVLHYSHHTAAPGARKCTLDMRKASGRRMDEKRYNRIEPGDRKAWWDDFVEVFGPYLSGDHFRNGHRGPIPAPGFYLTFHESWPLNLRAFFNGNPDAYLAFREKPEYAKTFVAILEDFIRTAKKEGWRETGFQVYLNNKGSLNDPRKSAWILDEPTAYFDYRALAYYGDLVARAKGEDCPVPIRYRIDISRPQFDRGELLGKSDLWVVNMAAFRGYPRLIADRAELTGEEIWTYGSSNRVEESNRKIHSWVLQSYRGGARGVVPWQTVVRDSKALRKGDPLALFIPAGDEIHPSLRLKAFRRAQQDVEYLELLRSKLGLTPGGLRTFLDRYLPTDAERSPEGFRRLREAAAALLE